MTALPDAFQIGRQAFDHRADAVLPVRLHPSIAASFDRDDRVRGIGIAGLRRLA